MDQVENATTADAQDASFGKFDALIHVVEESDLTPEEARSKVLALFPSFDYNSDCHNDKFLTDFRLEKIHYNASLGLSLVEVAYSVDISATVMKQIYNGVRVSLERLVRFAKAITFARAKIKVTHLGTIEKGDGIGAAVTFLEKAFSSKYGDRKIIDIQTGFAEEVDAIRWSVEVHHVENQIKRTWDEEQAALSEADFDGEEAFEPVDCDEEE